MWYAFWESYKALIIKGLFLDLHGSKRAETHVATVLIVFGGVSFSGSIRSEASPFRRLYEFEAFLGSDARDGFRRGTWIVRSNANHR